MDDDVSQHPHNIGLHTCFCCTICCTITTVAFSVAISIDCRSCTDIGVYSRLYDSHFSLCWRPEACCMLLLYACYVRQHHMS